MQRGPDAGGLGFWTSCAAGGSQNRQNVLNAFAGCGAFHAVGGTLYREAFWLVADCLGTPRMIVDKSGSLASVRRHDYLPFGEELFGGPPSSPGLGGRTTTQGYAGDSVRQKFTGYEADAETGLNFAQARYQSSAQGRFTSVDPLMASASVVDPQSLNRYSYVQNNPVNFTDPTGMMLSDIGVYQTANPECASILERTMVRLFQQAIRPPDPPAHSGGGEHHGGPETTAGGEHNHADSGGPGEHSSSDDTDLGVHEDPQGTETGTDLADRASAGLRDHPGLLENIRSNTNSAVDVRIVVCQAAKESNYAKLSETPRAFVNRYKSGSVGADGEIGLLQIMPSTGKRYGASVDQLKAVGTNVKVATNYLVHIKNRFAIDMRTTLAVYNWGEGHYQKFVDGKIKQIYPGSLSYADKILDCSRRVVLPGDASSPHKIFK